MKLLSPITTALLLGLLTSALPLTAAEPADSTTASKPRGFKALFTKRSSNPRIRRSTSNTRHGIFKVRPISAAAIQKPAPKPQPQPTTNPYITNQRILNQSNRANTSVVIDISRQRAYLLVNGQTAASAPVSTARPGKSTPRGTFYMSERVRSGKISNIYHVGMPYWMRLGSTAYGVHAGHLPGYPASAGCVRLPYSAAQLIYDHTRSGTRVAIYSSWARN